MEKKLALDSLVLLSLYPYVPPWEDCPFMSVYRRGRGNYVIGGLNNGGG